MELSSQRDSDSPIHEFPKSSFSLCTDVSDIFEYENDSPSRPSGAGSQPGGQVHDGRRNWRTFQQKTPLCTAVDDGYLQHDPCPFTYCEATGIPNKWTGQDVEYSPLVPRVKESRSRMTSSISTILSIRRRSLSTYAIRRRARRCSSFRRCDPSAGVLLNRRASPRNPRN